MVHDRYYCCNCCFLTDVEEPLNGLQHQRYSCKNMLKGCRCDVLVYRCPNPSSVLTVLIGNRSTIKIAAEI